MKKIGRLHVITDATVQKRFSHIDIAKFAIKGGADTIQYREKHATTKEMIKTAGTIRDICKSRGITFIVNDRVDIAMAVEADGVHLGQDDFPISLARKILGDDFIIGGSASSFEELKRCMDEGADYIGFGSVFPTSSKPDAGPEQGVDMLKEVVKMSTIPIVAIGGINESNLRDVLLTGVHGIAVISAVCCKDDPELATKELLRIMKIHQNKESYRIKI